MREQLDSEKLPRTVDSATKERLRHAFEGKDNVHCAFIAGSLVEGFGNATSDLDVFVIRETPVTESNGIWLEDQSYAIEIDFMEDAEEQIRTDTESWHINTVKDVIATVNTTSLNDWTAAFTIPEPRLQLAHAIRIGEAVTEAQRFAEIASQFDWQRLSTLLRNRFLMLYDGFVEDCAGALQDGDRPTASQLSRWALGAAADAYLASRGLTNGKAKWRFAKLRSIQELELYQKLVDAEMAAGPLLEASKSRLRMAADLSIRAQAG
jgi:predicted nucleotidyltransferase